MMTTHPDLEARVQELLALDPERFVNEQPPMKVIHQLHHIKRLVRELWICRPSQEPVEEEPWQDTPDDFSGMIANAHPTRTGDHATYEVAMRLVSHRHSKGALVNLVNCLLKRQVPAMHCWQPIATAPKDGTWFLGYTNDPGSHLPACGVVAVKWIDPSQGFSTRGVCGIELTHWMPLPPPPAHKP